MKHQVVRKLVIVLFVALQCVSTSFAAATCDFDIDGNGTPDARTDGLLLIRHLLGISGSELTQGALGAGATRSATEIQSFIRTQNYDLDGNKKTAALTDGLLAARYLTGMRGAALSAGAVGSNTRRKSGQDIAAFAQNGCSADELTVNCANAIGDAQALQNTINTSQDGDVIRMHGTCLIEQTISLKGNRSYVGGSRTGTVLRAASASLPAVLASDAWFDNSPTTGGPIRIQHLTIQGPGATAATITHGIIIRSWQTVIEDLQIFALSGDGIRITNPSRNGTLLTNSQVNGRISNVFIEGTGGSGIRVFDPGNSITDWSLLDSWISTAGASGIHLDNAAGWMVRGNHIYAINDDAIRADRCFGTTISDNYVEDFGGSSTCATNYGIRCSIQGDTASTIYGNRVFRLNPRPLPSCPALPSASAKQFIHIGVPSVNYGVAQLAVTGNVIRGADPLLDIGLSFVVGGGQGLNLTSSGNNVQNVVTPRVIGAGVTLTSGY